MKKIALFSMVALALLFTQCKKNDVKPVAADEGIFISLNANYNGGKTGFDPASNSFVWSNTTEYVNVGGSESGYLGQIHGTGTGSSQTITFSGTIATPQTDETLYFMYLGNGDHAEATTGTETGTLDFSNQAGTQAGVTDYHIAVGSAVYTGSTEFSATLEMKAAFARINMSAFSGETVYVHGDDIYATATVNYKTGTIEKGIKGYINVGAANDDRFVALIPSTTSETTIKFDSNKKSGSMTFLNGIKAGKFYSADNNGSALSFANAPQTESSKGLFSVAGTTVGSNDVITKMVRFSPGNLQYKPSTGEWRFAPNQYDMCVTPDMTRNYYYLWDEDWEVREEITAEQYEEYLGTEMGDYLEHWEDAYDATDDYSPSGTNWIDLFGWGTSGYENRYPYMTDGDGSAYGLGRHVDIAGTNADWGLYNDIYNPSTDNTDVAGTWRTIQNTYGAGIHTETKYLYSHSIYGYATIDGVHGIIILPDNTAVTINTDRDSWDDNIFTTDEWVELENAGVVFLPAAGARDVDGCGGLILGINEDCTYWSSSVRDFPLAMLFSEYMYSNEYAMQGFSVRLVRDVD